MIDSQGKTRPAGTTPLAGLLAALRAALRRAEVERRLALALVIGAIVSSVATYAAISGLGPYGASVRTVILLLNLDLVLLLLLGVVVARRLVALFLERRRGGAGSRLHTRLVGLFSLVAVAPAILVAVFSVAFLGSGLESWFATRVRTALDNSLAVAEAYLSEHREVIRADALAMAADLNREGPALLDQPAGFRQLVSAQAAIRALSEAVVFDGTGRVLAAAGLGVALGFEGVPEEALARAARGEAVTLTSDSDDRVRALVRLDGFGDAYLFVGRLVDPKVLAFMERTQKVVSDYRLIETERSGIQITSALIFMTVALLLLMAAVWLGIGFADRLATPLGRVIEAAERVRAGDLVVRVPEADAGADDEIGTLARAFNRMTSQLDAQRRALVRANRELDERRRFIEAVLGGVTAGVIGLDGDRRILLANPSAAALLGIAEEELAGRPLDAHLPETEALFDRLLADGEEPVREPVTVTRRGRQRTLLVRLAAQRDPKGISGFVLTFDDVTELIAAQRQAAWAEVARRIAHEIKNPLTPIRLSAERLGRRFKAQVEPAERDGFGRAIETIVHQVDAIGRLVSEFSAFARMPAPVLKSESLAELVSRAVLLQQTARPQIAFALELPADDPLRLECDAEKIGQVMTNLLQNAVDALGEAAAPPPGGPRITVRAARHGREIRVEVEDNGPGFPPGDRHRLLEPYATTRAKGTGLGLAIVRKIMEEHSGRVELADGSAGGALVRLAFPVRSAA